MMYCMTIMYCNMLRYAILNNTSINCITIDSIIIMILYTMIYSTMSQASTDDTPKSPN